MRYTEKSVMDGILVFFPFACKLVDNCSAEENSRKTRCKAKKIT